jgi:hypothetical protein
MDNLQRKSQDELFSELGLAISEGKVEIGKVYPIFGMITQINECDGEDIKVEINHQIKANLKIRSAERLEVLRQKAFESGIFVAKIISLEPGIEVECQAVIFGRSQAFNA